MADAPIARGIGIAAAWIVGYAAQNNYTLDAETITTIMLIVYSAVHSGVRYLRRKKLVVE